MGLDAQVGASQALLGAVLDIPNAVACFWPILAVVGIGILLSFYFLPWRMDFAARLRYSIGFFCGMNFLCFWLGPMVLQGGLYKQLTMPYLKPIFDAIDNSPLLRKFAAAAIYNKPKHADYFGTQMLFVLNFIPNLVFVFYVQKV